MGAGHVIETFGSWCYPHKAATPTATGIVLSGRGTPHIKGTEGVRSSLMPPKHGICAIECYGLIAIARLGGAEVPLQPVTTNVGLR
jgi:hypothetical protein